MSALRASSCPSRAWPSRPPRVSSSSAPSRRDDGGGGDGRPAGAPDRSSPAPAGTPGADLPVRVALPALREALEADGATPILDVAESADVLMPSGCRMGICYGCVLPLREGAVRDLRNGELTVAAPGDGVLIQTCVSAAAGACDIDH